MSRSKFFFPIWDELPEEFDVKSTTPKLLRDTRGTADKLLIIPDKIDEESFYDEASAHGKRITKNAWWINSLLEDYHALSEWTFQDFLSERLWIWIDFANTLAELSVLVYQELNTNEEDEGIEELDPNNMTF